MKAETLIPLLTAFPDEERADRAAFILKNDRLPIYRDILLSAAGVSQDKIAELGKVWNHS